MQQIWNSQTQRGEGFPNFQTLGQILCSKQKKQKFPTKQFQVNSFQQAVSNSGFQKQLPAFIKSSFQPQFTRTETPNSILQLKNAVSGV